MRRSCCDVISIPPSSSPQPITTVVISAIFLVTVNSVNDDLIQTPARKSRAAQKQNQHSTSSRVPDSLLEV